MEGLPKDVIYSCLCPYLSLVELARCAQVSRKWLEMFRANGAFRHIKDRIYRAVPSLSPENNYFLFLNNVYNLSAINDITIYELLIYILPTLSGSIDHYCYEDVNDLFVFSFFLNNGLEYHFAIIITTLSIFEKKNDICCRDTRLRDALYKLLFD
jgi:hypothetical protein